MDSHNQIIAISNSGQKSQIEWTFDCLTNIHHVTQGVSRYETIRYFQAHEEFERLIARNTSMGAEYGCL